MAVVAIPLTVVEGSPALKLSGLVGGQSPPSCDLMRWMIDSAVNGVEAARVAAPATSANCLLEISLIGVSDGQNGDRHEFREGGEIQVSPHFAGFISI
jgi:hypothetical protein